MRSPLEQLSESIRSWLGLPEAPDVWPLLRPVPPYEPPGRLGPVATAATALGLAILAGVGVGALLVLFLVSLAAWAILTEILGITIELRPA